MTNTIPQLKYRPEPCQAPSRRKPTVHTRDITPDAEEHQGSVRDREASRQVAAQKATDESRRRENVEKAEDILLDRVCGLSHDQRQEGRPAS